MVCVSNRRFVWVGKRYLTQLILQLAPPSQFCRIVITTCTSFSSSYTSTHTAGT